MAHITGGGLLENIPRVLPDTVCVRIDAASWQAPPVFSWMAKVGNISALEMARTFNCGIGMAIITAPDQVAKATQILTDAGEKVFRIGVIDQKTTVKPLQASEQVILENISTVWPC